jgi:hypothetical protein
MKCQEFEAVIGDLASRRPMQADVRQGALRHAAHCLRCASRLADEQTLTTALRLAASVETEEAPVRVRVALLTAFAERTASPVSTAKRFAAVNGWLRWALAAAVLLIVIAATSWLRLLPARPPEQVATMRAPEPEYVPRHQVEQSNTATVGGQDAVAHSWRNTRRHRTHLVNIAYESRALTGYIPLTYLAESTAMESGQVVRLRLPRSVLVSLGLAMGLESSGELMEADLVIGDDGVARAIRLVQ